ncbi:hypothetical protein BCF44_10675 [Kutzneria buriramensis]|uniref:Uncharacterized protein n=1 Tax=Kutzneria buriramensis TaxID=1045776 RepID=A0A3E0HKD6_9PSEU|nr:hypothetical protein BCF44_10675 [Kutzneria buriramensis]
MRLATLHSIASAKTFTAATVRVTVHSGVDRPLRAQPP